jgi:hypothetical protein
VYVGIYCRSLYKQIPYSTPKPTKGRKYHLHSVCFVCVCVCCLSCICLAFVYGWSVSTFRMTTHTTIDYRSIVHHHAASWHAVLESTGTAARRVLDRLNRPQKQWTATVYTRQTTSPCTNACHLHSIFCRRVFLRPSTRSIHTLYSRSRRKTQ